VVNLPAPQKGVHAAYEPKAVADVPLGDIDTVVTLCAEECVVAPGKDLRREGWDRPDPALATGSEHDILAAFRATRDELRRRMILFVAA
jgi:arsenate reductase